MKKYYTQGGGKPEYSAPAIETLEFSSEKGFATSTNIDGTFETPGSVGDGSDGWWS